MKIRKIIGIIAAAILCVCAFTGCGTQSIDPESYCTVNVSGANGYAKAALEVDYKSLELVMASNSKKADSWEDQLTSALLADTIRFEITSKTEELSNGDTVNVNVKFNEDALKKMGFKMTKSSFTYKVDGLEDANILDPFEGLAVSFDGISPKGSVSIDKSGCAGYIRKNVEFEAESDGKFANGEKCVIKINYDESKAMSNGFVLSPTEKEFEVSGLIEYVTDFSALDFSEIDSNYSDKLRKLLSEKNITAGTKKSGDSILQKKSVDNWKITDVEWYPVKNIYMYGKNGFSNKRFVVFEVKYTAEKLSKAEGISPHDEYEDGAEYIGHHYAYVSIENVAVNPDGTMNLDYAEGKDMKLFLTCRYPGGNTSMTLDSLVKEIEDKNIDNYKITTVDR